MPRISYVCPETRGLLSETEVGLVRDDGKAYPFLPRDETFPGSVPVFLELAGQGEGQRASLEMYDTATVREVYGNFLAWLFATFDEDEQAFRRGMAARLRLSPGDRVLITGCGLGDDIPAMLEAVGPAGEVYAQDLSPAMTREAARRLARERPDQAGQVHFSAGNALKLPFEDGVFDAAFHFGGLNLFDDVGQGLAEMDRVVRPGGRVVASDEGVAPWLRDTDYGRMAITNNRLWAYEAPIDKLPPTASDVALTWTMGNCFWVIEFTVREDLPRMNPNVPHKGWRGGSMWTRHHGQLEGVTPETRARVLEAAKAAGVSVHDWLEGTIQERLGDTPAGSSL